MQENSHKISTRILWGLLVGAIIGMGFNLWGPTQTREWLLTNVFDPIGQVFLRGLFVIIVPLVFSSLASGIANLGSTQKVRRLGWKIAAYYLGTTLAAVLIGQVIVSIVQPGAGIPLELVEQNSASSTAQIASLSEKSTQVATSLWPGIIGAIIPTNLLNALANGEMLAVIFTSLLFGVALISTKKTEENSFTLKVFHEISQASICIVGWVMSIAPYAVAALMIGAVSRFGLALMINVGQYVMVVILGFAVHLVVTYGLIMKGVIGIPIWSFYKLGFPAIATAFSTSSSNATIPTTIHTLETRFKVPESITTFSVPLGATINMDGTALFEVVAALFIAQVYGIDITLMGQATLAILILISSVGVAGVPGGSVPILMSAMASLGIPVEGIAMILGVDRLLDMLRTTVNVTGDMAGALFLAKTEGEFEWKP